MSTTSATENVAPPAPATDKPAAPSSVTAEGGAVRKPSRRRGRKRATSGSSKPTKDQLPAAEKSAPPTSPPSPTKSSASETAVSGSKASGEKEYIKEIAKRLRKTGKKLENIKKSEDKIKDLPEEEKQTTKLINDDERKKISEKPLVLAIHKEVTEIHDLVRAGIDAEAREQEAYLEAIKKARDDATNDSIKVIEKLKKEHLESVEQIKKEFTAGEKERNKANILSVVKFLRLAGYRRSEPSGDAALDQAIENVLVMVYNKQSKALDTCLKLASAADIPIDEGESITFKRISEEAHGLKIEADDEPDQEPEQAEPVKVQGEDAVAQLINHGEEAESDSSLVQVPPEQSIAESPEVISEVPQVVPSASAVDDGANAAAKEVEPELQTTESVIPNEASDTAAVPTVESSAPKESITEGYITVNKSEVPAASAAEDASDKAALNADDHGQGETDVKNTEGRRGGRGRGEHRGRGRGFRGRGGDGEFRGRGRGRGEFRGDRGSYRGEHRGRGRGGFRGGRGGSNATTDGEGVKDASKADQHSPKAVEATT